MIDKANRLKLAKALRELAAGEITTYAFCRLSFGKYNDAAVVSIPEYASMCFDELKSYRLKGPYKLPDEQLKAIERCVLFLQTDKKYRWPPYAKGRIFGWLSVTCFFLVVLSVFIKQYTDLTYIAGILVGTVIIGWMLIWTAQRRFTKRVEESFWKAGDKNAWPFLTQAEHEATLQSLRQS